MDRGLIRASAVRSECAPPEGSSRALDRCTEALRGGEESHRSLHLVPTALSCGKEGNRYQIPQATEMISYFSESKTSETWSSSQNHHIGQQELWLSLRYLINGTPAWLYFLF